jgi:hypothetical protein
MAWEKGFHRKAYEIFPVNRRCLHWIQGGKDVFAMHASIPEQTFPAKPFIKPALAKNRTKIDRDLKQSLAKVLQGK